MRLTTKVHVISCQTWADKGLTVSPQNMNKINWHMYAVLAAIIRWFFVVVFLTYTRISVPALNKTDVSPECTAFFSATILPGDKAIQIHIYML